MHGFDNKNHASPQHRTTESRVLSWPQFSSHPIRKIEQLNKNFSENSSLVVELLALRGVGRTQTIHRSAPNKIGTKIPLDATQPFIFNNIQATHMRFNATQCDFQPLQIRVTRDAQADHIRFNPKASARYTFLPINNLQPSDPRPIKRPTPVPDPSDTRPKARPDASGDGHPIVQHNFGKSAKES